MRRTRHEVGARGCYALEHLRASWPAHVVTLLLPVDHRAAHDHLRRALDEHMRTAVLCTGLAGACIRIERQARRPEQLAGEAMPLCAGRWPWAEIRVALQAAAVDVVDSFDAGQYVCGSTYWSLLTDAGRAQPPEFAAFLHVPPASREHPIARIAGAIGNVVSARRAELEALERSATPALSELPVGARRQERPAPDRATLGALLRVGCHRSPVSARTWAAGSTGRAQTKAAQTNTSPDVRLSSAAAHGVTEK